MNAPPDPAVEYSRRLEERRRSLESLEQREKLIVNLRLATGVSFLGLGLLALSVHWLSMNWVALPLVVFCVLVVIHWSLTDRLEQIRLAVEYYISAQRRLDHTWQGTGIQRIDFVGDDHPYAADLDLFGSASLFELMCTARTISGEEKLAHWLANPAAIEEIYSRHEAVDELCPLIDLREDLAILGGRVRSLVHPGRLIEWGEAPQVFSRSRVVTIRAIAFPLSLALIGCFVLWVADLTSALPFWIVLLAVWLFYSAHSKKVAAVVKDLETSRKELLVLSLLLKRLEIEDARCRRLAGLKKTFKTGGRTASRSIRHLDRLVNLMDAGRNQAFAPVAFALLWQLHLPLAIESWRIKNGASIRQWLDATGEYEALCALACYAYEHQADPYPELVGDGPVFNGDNLKHPLLADDVIVPNDVRLDSSVRGWVVSGSNMSGKSTLLRTVGVNAVLAFAGAPVHAKSLILSPLHIGATMRLEDSLQAGHSRFYSEIRRLKHLMDLTADGRPLLFLLDEILHGTNSRDRLIGSKAVVQGMIEAGAIGLVTTHDLALTSLAEESDGSILNMFFEDQLGEGRLVFDYKVKPGILKRGNALDLMRSIGLDVEGKQ